MFDTILAALESTGIPFRKYAWTVAPSTDYGVIALESGGDTVWADGHMVGQVLEGSIDLFTRNAGETQFAAVQAALRGVEGLSWYFNSAQYEEDTKLMHFEWVISWAA